MSVLRNLESKLAGLVEGTFGRVFRTEVQPVELARKLAKEMDEHRTVSVSRTYVPNEYVVWLSPEDRARFDGMERELADELSAYLLEHARREKLALVSRPEIAFRTDEALALGEFGIQARLVRSPEHDDRAAAAAPAPVQAEHGNTMIYSTAARLQEPLGEERAKRGQPAERPSRRAYIVADGRRIVVPAAGGVIGRSRDCEVVLSDTNVSRRHAELRPRDGGWVLMDLGSTNGVRVNGRAVQAATPLSPGDRIELGTVPIRFEEG